MASDTAVGIPTGNPPRAIYLVRHADKLGDDLSPTGELQAEKLADLLQDAGITSIYTSQIPRTKATAQPLIQRLAARGQTPRVFEVAFSKALKDHPDDPALLASYGQAVRTTMSRESVNEIVLVVGHDATVPAVIKSFGYTGPVSIKPDEFDHLFLLLPRGGQRPPGFLHILHYAS
jgi:phosphohistidine phosphatase SixA